MRVSARERRRRAEFWQWLTCKWVALLHKDPGDACLWGVWDEISDRANDQQRAEAEQLRGGGATF